MVHEPAGVDRKRWPVRGGVPVPRGELLDPGNIRLLDAEGREIPVQGLQMAMWPAVTVEGRVFPASVQWLQLSFVADLAGGEENRFTLEYGREVQSGARPEYPVRVNRGPGGVEVGNGRVRIRLTEAARFVESICAGEQEVFTDAGPVFSLNLDVPPGTLDDIPVVPLPTGPVPEIDGRLEDGEWANARMVDLQDFRLNDAPEQPTRGRLLLDDENLYVALECFDSDMAHVQAPDRDHDRFDIRYDDHVVVYIDPAYTGETRRTGPANRRCFENFVAVFVSASGCVREQLIHGGMEYWDAEMAARTEGPFKTSVELEVPGMEVATAREADRWVVEMKIPLDAVRANWSWTGKGEWHDSSFSFMKDPKYRDTFGLSLYRHRAARETGGGGDQRWPVSLSYMNCPPLKMARVPRPGTGAEDDPLPGQIVPSPTEEARVVVKEVVVEEEGAVESVVRVRGEYVCERTLNSAFTMRFHVCADRAAIRCLHTVHVGLGPYGARLGGYGFELPGASVSGAGVSLMDGRVLPAAPGSEFVQYRQDSYRATGTDADGSRGGQLQGGLTATVGGARVGLGVEAFWEKFPAGIKVDGERVVLQMVSPRAFPIFFGLTGELQDDYGTYELPGEVEPARVNNTHEFWVSFEGEDAVSLGKMVRQRVLPFAGAEWNCASRACGLMAPYDRALFPLVEDYTDYALWWNINETFWRGWYGWGDYGNVMNSPVARLATNHPRMYEWGYLRRGGYGWANDRKNKGLGYMTAWFRSGRRPWFDFGEALVRNSLDVCTTYPTPADGEDPICRPRRHPQLVWASPTGSAARQGGQPGWVLFYFLTGDLRARDVILMHARQHAGPIPEDGLPGSGGTSTSSTHATRYVEYRHLLNTWLMTGDEGLRQKLEGFNDLALKPALRTGKWAVRPDRFRWPALPDKDPEFQTAWGDEMPGMGHELGQWEGPLRYYQLMGDPALGEVLMRMASDPGVASSALTEVPELSRLMIWSNGYEDPMLRYADLYRWTGDPQLLAQVAGARSVPELAAGPLTRSPVPPAEPERLIHPAEFCERMSLFPRLPVHYLYPTGMTFRPLILYTLHQAVKRRDA